MKKAALGDWVQSIVVLGDLDDDGEFLLYATKGDIGHIIEMNPGHCPTIAWERTGTVCDAAPEDFIVLCDFAFATRPENTPGFDKRK